MLSEKDKEAIKKLSLRRAIINKMNKEKKKSKNKKH